MSDLIYGLVICCMEQKAQNYSTSGIVSLVWVILA